MARRSKLGLSSLRLAESSIKAIGNIVEPQVTSTDPNERKLARRLRIERRWNKIQAKTEDIVEPADEKTPLQVQFQKSTVLLTNLLEEGDDYITAVRLAVDAREVDRREAEGIGREKIIRQLENEASEANKMFEEIAVKWSVIQQYNDPLAIKEDITNQKERCDLLISQKDGIIAMLKDAIKEAERKYTRDQKKQEEDVNKLTKRIQKQIIFMRHAYKTEFQLIKNSALVEQKIFMEMNNEKWEDLYEKQKELEIKNMKSKEEQIEEFNKRLTNLRENFQEQYRKLKIKLSKDIDEMQHEFENIKSTTLMNREKIDYNYQLLKKREDENLIIKSQQKRRLNKLHDVIDDLKHKISQYETTAKKSIEKLTENTIKLKQNIMDIEAKADHFAKINDEKFHQIWEMNKNACEEILRKILMTDKVLHEQQMGIEWTEPSMLETMVAKQNLPSYKTAMKKVGKTRKSISENILKFEENSEEHNKSKNNAAYRKLLKQILTKVSDKCGFLTEPKLKYLLKPYQHNDNNSLVYVSDIFESLGITNHSDIDLMVRYFLPFAYCTVCDRIEEANLASRYTTQMTSSILCQLPVDDEVESSILDEAFLAIQQPKDVIDHVVLELVTSDSEEFMGPCGELLLTDADGERREKRTVKQKVTDTVLCQYQHPLFMNISYIVLALKQFVMDYYKKRATFPTTQERLNRKRYTVSRLLEQQDIEFYWNKFKNVYNQPRIAIWNGLYEGLKQYHEILKSRKCLYEDVAILRKQNADLKKLLSNYDQVVNDIPCKIEDKPCIISRTPPYIKAKWRNK